MPTPATMVKLMKALGMKAPQDDALEIARINAVKMLGLPENNTPMDRARALGFDTPAYHGSPTPEGIVKKGLLVGGDAGSHKTGDAYGSGIYTSTSPSDASSYAKGEGAVFPLMIRRSNHLNIDSPKKQDLKKLSELASKQMLPSDKARFPIGRQKQEFKDVQDARDFFATQRANWEQFGDGMDRARPEAIANSDGTFAVEFTNFDADVPITNGAEADTLLRALGYDNVPAMGYSGHTMNRSSGRQWDVTNDLSKLRSRFAAFDPARVNENNLLASRLLPFALPGLLAIPQDE